MELDDWETIKSESTGKNYYFNPKTGESSWLRPSKRTRDEDEDEDEDEFYKRLRDNNENEFIITDIHKNKKGLISFTLNFMKLSIWVNNIEIGYKYGYYDNEVNISFHSLFDEIPDLSLWIMCGENYIYFIEDGTGTIDISLNKIKTNTDMRQSLRECIREIIELGVPNHVNLEN